MVVYWMTPLLDGRPSEPNNVGGSEDCVEIHGQNLFWNDDDENEQKSYLIEYSSYVTDPNLVDSDGDGLTDGEEFSLYYTNPTILDTDGDGVDDDLDAFPNDPMNSDSMAMVLAIILTY